MSPERNNDGASARTLTELVWDEGTTATGTTARGASLAIGGPTGLRTEELIGLAAEVDLMQRFLRRAGEEGIEVLGYVSAFETLDPAAAGPPETAGGGVPPAGRPAAAPFRFRLRPCVLVAHCDEVERVRALLAGSFRASPVATALAGLLTLEADAFLVRPEDSGPCDEPEAGHGAAFP